MTAPTGWFGAASRGSRWSVPERRPQLGDWANNVFSQFGEDGALAEVLRRLGITGGTCVEYGAADGLSCSNTARLWRGDGWRAVLIEADPKLAQRAEENGYGYDVTVIPTRVAPGGPGCVDDLLDALGVGEVEVMSIDIDGDDYWHLCSLRRRPRVLLVEFNPTVPPQFHVEPAGPGNRFGVGAATLRRAAEWKGYTMVGVLHANMVLVRTEEADPFADLETDLAVLMPPEDFMFLATDQDGFVVPCGAAPEWGLRWPPSPTVMAANQPAVLHIRSDDPHERFAQQVLSELAKLRQALARRDG